MIRIRIIKAHKDYKEGDVLEVDNNTAFGLIDSGVAIASKDMTAKDYVTKGQNAGIPLSKLRKKL